LKLQQQGSLCDAAASIDSNYRPEGFYDHSIYVNCVQGDEIVKDMGIASVAIIKVDVEGAELEVLTGFTNTLQEHSPCIVFEVLNHFLRATNTTLPGDIVIYREQKLRKLEVFFVEHGYTVYQINFDHTLRKTIRFEPDTTDNAPTNYVAIPESSTALQGLPIVP
jgi:hypothetical protein